MNFLQARACQPCPYRASFRSLWYNCFQLLLVSICLLVFPSPKLMAEAALRGSLGIHDPSAVMQCEGLYYVYGTGQGIISKSSVDGVYWVTWGPSKDLCHCAGVDDECRSGFYRRFLGAGYYLFQWLVPSVLRCLDFRQQHFCNWTGNYSNAQS